MKPVEIIKDAFVVIGYGAAGRWNDEMVYPIPHLWEKAYEYIADKDISKIVGVCLPLRSDQYYYTYWSRFYHSKNVSEVVEHL